MAKTKLIIRKEQANRKGVCTIYVLYTNAGRNTYFSTIEQIKPEFWDSVNCRVKDTYPCHLLLNEYLFKFQIDIENIKLRLKLKGVVPHVDLVKEEYQSKHPGVDPRRRGFLISLKNTRKSAEK